MSADQAVHVVDHDPAWLARFADQRDRISAVLDPWLADAVEHIGSTSVAGMPAKPVVDILAPVRSLDEARAAVPALAADGWLYWPDDPCRHYRLWFLRPRPEARTHHLHVIEHGHPQARALLAFRDALRADQTLREDYADLKRRLAVEYRDNRNAYTNAKGNFVEQVLRGAGIQPLPRDLLPE
ncbi:GrpB family protein [Frankia sp. AiPs1]|uniref:GrpB family protein n=1 Tax=Frankia sp. AiPa1 TaxID=573492 RepID=UPI00202B7A57|nr:GrpB family protein [Frankia sp. AiPa1]MCL9759151.1 GrpB family protein [Frankia sp. AiPa1]